MTSHSEFDPDDNFGHSFQDGADIDDEATVEALVWQLLLLINPDDEDAALQQFTAYQEALADAADEPETMEVVREVIDWKSGFHVAEEDTRALTQSLEELAARWNLHIEWGVEDPTDDEFLDGNDVSGLINIAFDRLREYHYTLWTWETDSEHQAGFITHRRDEEALRLVANALGIHVRAGAG